MKCIAHCGEGIEEVLSSDITRLTDVKKVDVRTRCCIFEADEQTIAHFAYHCQSCEHVGVLLHEAQIPNDISEISAGDCSIIKKTYATSCKTYDCQYVSQEIAERIVEDIIAKTEVKSRFKDAAYKVYILADSEQYYVSLLLHKKELVKRDYKVFPHKNSLRGTTAYVVSQLAGITNTDVMLDPFCRSGEICIELAYARLGKSIHHYTKDKFVFKALEWDVKLEDSEQKIEQIHCCDCEQPNVKAAEKNAKIGGVNSFLTYSRILTEDLDLRYEDIDKIVTQLPIFAHAKKKEAEIYSALFTSADKVLTKKGTITCVCMQDITEFADECGFIVANAAEIHQGKELLKVYTFKRK